jgi:2-(1,2-epoxy-1,2-dihydrophenyl)acetyl-CoA isomerase
MSVLRVERDDGIATLTLDRPDALNALTVELKEALLEAFGSIAADDGLRAVVLTGAGRAFCAGQDLQERLEPDALPLEEEIRRRYNPLIRAMRSLNQPIVGAINGVAAGAGAALAFACDVRVAAENASFRLAFGRVGLIPDSGATWLLPRLIGGSRAAELALLDEPLMAAEALRIGLVIRVVPEIELATAARDIAGRLAASAPIAMVLTKRALEQSWDASLDAQLEFEALAQGLAGGAPDHAEGIAAFIGKRPPRFSGASTDDGAVGAVPAPATEPQDSTA